MRLSLNAAEVQCSQFTCSKNPLHIQTKYQSVNNILRNKRVMVGRLFTDGQFMEGQYVEFRTLEVRNEKKIKDIHRPALLRSKSWNLFKSINHSSSVKVRVCSQVEWWNGALQARCRRAASVLWTCGSVSEYK